MPPARKRRRFPDAARTADWIEEVGGEVLMWVWSLAVRVARAVAYAAAVVSTSLWRWLRRQTREVQVVIGVACVAALAWLLYFRPAARAVSTDSDVEALARVIHSEVGAESQQERLHVAWATRNLAAQRGESIADMVCQPCGPQGAGRPVSSRLAARDEDRALARVVLAAPVALDPTGGATHFIDPALQDKLARRGVAGYRGRSYRVVKRRWRRVYGWRIYYRLGPDLEFWGPKRRPAGR